MDGAGARNPYSTVATEALARQVATSRKVVAVARTVLGVGLSGAAVSADLGGSSK